MLPTVVGYSVITGDSEEHAFLLTSGPLSVTLPSSLVLLKTQLKQRT